MRLVLPLTKSQDRSLSSDLHPWLFVVWSHSDGLQAEGVGKPGMIRQAEPAAAVRDRLFTTGERIRAGPQLP